MVQITLKARHFYYITYYLRGKSIQNYYPLINRISVVLKGNNDLTASFTVSSSPSDVIDMFKILTYLPEGQANTINVEMDDLLLPQITQGVADEQAAGIEPDADGNLPDNAYWQIIARGITYQKTMNTDNRNSAIQFGKDFIDTI